MLTTIVKKIHGAKQCFASEDLRIYIDSIYIYVKAFLYSFKKVQHSIEAVCLVDYDVYTLYLHPYPSG